MDDKDYNWKNRKDTEVEQDYLQYVGKHIVKKTKTRKKNLVMTLIDYKKTFDTIPQTWMIGCLKTCKISKKGQELHHGNYGKVETRINNRRKNVNAGENKEGHVPLLFVIPMMPSVYQQNKVRRNSAIVYCVKV